MGAITLELDDLKALIDKAVADAVRPFAAAITPKPKREIWNPSQFAHELGLSDVETVRTWCKEGRIEATRNATDGWEISNDMFEAVRFGRDCKPFAKGTYDNPQSVNPRWAKARM